MTKYIGQQPVNGAYVKLDNITTSATNTYNLLNGGVAYSPQSALNCIVSLNGVIQNPNSAYTISGSQITFIPSTGTLSSDDVIDFIIVLGDVGQFNTVSDDAISTAKIQNDAITTDKINLISTGSAPSLEAKGDGSSQDGYIQLNCSQNSHGVKLKSPPHSAGQSYTLTLPQSITNDYFLKTDGSGNLSFAEVQTDTSGLQNDLSRLGLRVYAQDNVVGTNSDTISYDVFQDSSKIENLTNTVRDTTNEFISSVVADAGSYETGNRNSTYGTIDATVSMGAGSNSNMIDGGTASNNSDSVQFSNEAASGLSIWIDLGSGNSKMWTGAKWTHQPSDEPSGSTTDMGTWKYQGSNNNTDWTDLSSTFKFNDNSATTETLWSNTTAYRYIRMLGVSGNIAGSAWIKEWELRVGSLTDNASGSFEGTAITASSSRSSIGAVVNYEDNVGTNTLNTDLILQVSADNGSNWTTATLVALPDFSSSIKSAKANNISVTAGTQIKYKISFANQSNASKVLQVKGVSLQF